MARVTDFNVNVAPETAGNLLLTVQAIIPIKNSVFIYFLKKKTVINRLSQSSANEQLLLK